MSCSSFNADLILQLCLVFFKQESDNPGRLHSFGSGPSIKLSLWAFENTVSLLCSETHHHKMPCMPITNGMEHTPCIRSCCRTSCLCWDISSDPAASSVPLFCPFTWIIPTFLVALNQASSHSRKHPSLS